MLHMRAVMLTAFILMVAGCGGGSGSTMAIVPAPVVALIETVISSVSPTPSPTPSATPTPTATATVAPVSPPPQTPSAVAGGFVQLDPIPSNFDTAAEIIPMEVPPTMAPDDVGAFRFLCAPSHLAYDDPIVYASQPGAAHLHQFFGNTGADAYSTYASLRTTGESTCHSKLNRSAYWIPAMMNGRGQVVRPDFLAVYYKAFPANSPECKVVGICTQLPRGLRYVWGRKMDGVLPPERSQERLAISFNCSGTGAVGGTYDSMAEAAKNCPSGAQLGAVAHAPNCWNGTQLDSPDHRSHMSFMEYGADYILRCPKTHPYVVPFFTLSAWYTTDDTLDRSGSTDPARQTWHFASDRMPGMPALPFGQTFHADWFGAWDDPTLATWHTNCIDKWLSCTSGQLGNGTGMKWPAGFSFTANPRLVQAPVRTTTAMLCTGKRRLKPAEQQMIQAIRRKLDAATSKDTMLAAAKPDGIAKMRPAPAVV